MYLKSIVYLLLLSFCCIKNYAQNDSIFNEKKISNIALVNLNDTNPTHFSEKNKPFLFIFLSPDCPLCQNYSAALNSLQTKYGSEINFYGIIPGKAYTKKEIQTFQSTYKIDFPLYIDKEMNLSKYLKATVTPQVILLDKNKILIYKGAIDDLLQKLGKQKLKATKFYLQEAIENLLKQQPAEIKRTIAIGCKLNDY